MNGRILFLPILMCIPCLTQEQPKLFSRIKQRSEQFVTADNEKGLQINSVTLRYDWSERKDSNLRPLAPHASALPGCATPRKSKSIAELGQSPSRQLNADRAGPCLLQRQGHCSANQRYPLTLDVMLVVPGRSNEPLRQGQPSQPLFLRPICYEHQIS